MSGPHRIAFRKIAFASGKGGVGKTFFAANFSRLASTRWRTVLIDLDFQNQGSSGLLAQYLRAGCVNAFDLLSTGTFAADHVLWINEQLAFIPAFEPGKRERFALQQNPMFLSLGLRSVHSAFEALLTSASFDLVIADCHGGLDDISFSAFIESDCTLIVTEIDKVTFNGTLELLDYYWSRARELLAQGETSVAPNAEIRDRLREVQKNQVRLIVNRISGKYSYDTLARVFSAQLYQNFPEIQTMNQGFLYVPFDPIVSESFSEFPFLVEILPESIVAQKLELLHQNIFEILPVVEGRGLLYRWFEKLSPRKLQRRLTSAYEDRVKTVFTFTAIMQIVIIASAVGFLMVVAAGYEGVLQMPSVLLALLSAGMLWFLYLLRFYNRVSGYYRDRFRYELRLWRRKARSTSMIFLLRILTLWLFRSIPRVLAIFSMLYILVLGMLMVDTLSTWIGSQ